MEINLCLNCMKEKPGSGRCPHCGFDRDAYQEHDALPLETILAGRYVAGVKLSLEPDQCMMIYAGWDLFRRQRVDIGEYLPFVFSGREGIGNRLPLYCHESDRWMFREGAAQFVRAARIWGNAGLAPGIAVVRDCFWENQTVYGVWDLPEGELLGELLGRAWGHRLPPEVVFWGIRPVVRALGRLHQEGILYRNIRPDRFLVAPNGQLTLLPGISGETERYRKRRFLNGWESEMPLPTDPYRAPEYYQGSEKEGPWADVYSLCAVIYEAVTGKCPPEVPDRETALKKPSSLGVSLTARQEAALMKGLSYKREDRFSSMEELEAAL